MLERFAYADSQQMLMIYLAVFPVLLLLAPSIWRFATLKFSQVDILAPVFIAAGTVFIGTTLRTWFLVFDPEAPEKMFQVLGNYAPDEVLLNGLIVINSGIIAWFVGYFLPLPLKLNLAQKSSGFPKLNRVILIAAAICVLLNLNYLNQINFIQNFSELGFSAKRFFIVGEETVSINHRSANRTSYQYLKIGSDALFACVAIYSSYIYYLQYNFRNINKLSAFHTAQKLLPGYLILFVLLILAAFIPLVASVRGEIVYLVITIVLARHYIFKPIKLRYLVITFCLAMLLLTQLEILRQQSKMGDNADKFSISRVVHTLVYTAHFVGVGKTSAIVEHFPKKSDFHYGKSYLTVFIAPIPRVWWPEKPTVRIGKYVGGEVMGRNSNTGVVPGIIGEAYLNFGIGGVISILFLFGVFCKTTYKWILISGRTNPLMIGLYAIIWIFIMDMFTSDFTGSVIRFLRVAIPFWIILYFINKFRSPTGHPHPNSLQTAP